MGDLHSISALQTACFFFFVVCLFFCLQLLQVSRDVWCFMFVAGVDEDPGARLLCLFAYPLRE